MTHPRYKDEIKVRAIAQTARPSAQYVPILLCLVVVVQVLLVMGASGM